MTNICKIYLHKSPTNKPYKIGITEQNVIKHIKKHKRHQRH